MLNIVIKNKICSEYLIAGMLLSCIFTVSAFAQDRTFRPQLGTEGKATQIASEIDKVNLQNGNVSLNIPLASLPPVAGGKLSASISLNYNSKLYTARSLEKQGFSEVPGCQPTFNTSELSLESSGWSIGGGYSIVFRDAHEDYDYRPADSVQCFGNEYYNMQGKFFKPILVSPDGSEHEMRILGNYPTYPSIGNKDFLKNYYRYMGANQFPTFDSPTELYTVDGSYIKVVYNPPSYPVQWTAYLKDGTQILQFSDGQRIKDMNGNSIFHGYTASYSFVRDEQTGREIRSSTTYVNPQTSTSQISYQKVGGAWENINILWGKTDIQGKTYKAEEVDYDNGGGTCTVNKEFSTSVQTVRELTLPATEQNAPPRKYTFAYNSDSTAQATLVDPRWNCSDQVFPDYTRTASIGTGELSQITTPTGAIYKYHYLNDGQHDYYGEAPDIARNVVTSKELIHDGTTDTWTYSIDPSPSYVTVGGVTNPDGSAYRESFYPVGSGDPSYGGTNGFGGLTYRTTTFGGDINIVTEKRWTLLGGVLHSFGSGTGNRVSYNPVVDTEFTSFMDSNGNRLKMSAKKFQYDYNGDVTQTIEYDWFDSNCSVSYDNYGVPTGVPACATVLRTVNNSYYNQALNASASTAYHQRYVGPSPVILGLLQETSVGSSITRMSYDGQSYGIAPNKGNPTSVSSWNNTDSNWLNSSTTYDSYGNAVSKTDPNGGVTQIFYEDATHAMPTKVIVDPQNGTGQQISTTAYDYYTGLPTSATDVNGNTSSIDYTNHLLGAIDPFGRPGTTYSPYVNVDGVNKRRQTVTFYEDNARKVRAEADLNNEGDRVLKSTQSSDQLGRAILSEKLESNGTIVSSQNVYLQSGKVVLSSNPKRSAGAETNGWTRATKDLLGRVTEVASFKGDAQPPASGTNSDWMGSVLTNYYLNTKTVTDQAGRKRRGISDALSRTVQVIEDPDGQNLTTSYVFDEAGNIRKTIQGGQSRYFLYDSLSRLIRARQPELGTNLNLALPDALTGNGQWSNGYSYDANGNLISTTDARGTSISGTYDKLNRLTFRNYSDSTPDVTMIYDENTIQQSKGKLTKVITGDPNNNPLSITKYTAFNTSGGVLASEQITAQQPARAFSYSYNLAGNLTSQTYPSGRVVKQFYDNDDELAAVSGRSMQGAYKAYVTQIGYTSTGAVEKMQLGNGKWETAAFNSRGQITRIGLGNSATDTSLLKLDYDYGSAIENNGGLRKQTITVQAAGAVPGFVAVQNYTYDALNRLQSSSETLIGGQTPAWKQTFQYDRFGNRTFELANTTIPTVNPQPLKAINPQIDAATNRLIEDQDGDTVKDYDYDVVGNLIKNTEGRLFAYDAEGRQKSFGANGSETNGGQYFYDGQGKRVKKIVGNIETIFIYDAFGNLAAEYENVAPATAPTTKYLTQDHLGSPRIVTDQNGTVVSRHDYFAFGEEIIAGNLGVNDHRKVQQNYSANDNVRQQFTGYERDTESGLDYAQARYYNSRHGRFTSVDPLTASATIKNPQTFNRYSYALNSPYKFTDPLGLAARAVCHGGVTDENRNCTEEPATVAPPQIKVTKVELVAIETKGTPNGGSETKEVVLAKGTIPADGADATLNLNDASSLMKVGETVYVKVSLDIIEPGNENRAVFEEKPIVSTKGIPDGALGKPIDENKPQSARRVDKTEIAADGKSMTAYVPIFAGNDGMSTGKVGSITLRASAGYIDQYDSSTNEVGKKKRATSDIRINITNTPPSSFTKPNPFGN